MIKSDFAGKIISFIMAAYKGFEMFSFLVKSPSLDDVMCIGEERDDFLTTLLKRKHLKKRDKVKMYVKNIILCVMSQLRCAFVKTYPNRYYRVCHGFGLTK